jgi:Prolyl oligopeptidase family
MARQTRVIRSKSSRERRSTRWRLSIAVLFLLAFNACPAFADQNAIPSANKRTVGPDPEYIRKMIPTTISGTYPQGKLIELRVHGRMAYLVEPTKTVDLQKRWVWVFPFWLEINDGHGRLHHRFYVDKLLAAGFHVAGVNVGTSCGSPAAAKVCEEFYKLLTERYGLNRRARLMVQSNGGLIGYAWAFRHPESVERIGGICPATDFRTWPMLPNVVAFPEKGLDYGLTHEQLAPRISEFNPIDNLAPLAKAGVKILQIHGDKDELVPTEANSLELARRYKQLGGSAQVVLIPGLGHGGMPLYESKPLIDFLLAE